MKSLIGRAGLLWLGFCALAFINGAFREVIIKKTWAIHEPWANQISCGTGILLWTTFALYFWPRLKIQSFKIAFSVGLGWFLATFAFETFILDRNLSWDQVLSSYDLSAGRYWGLVLIWIGIIPGVFYSMSSEGNTQL